ncbi:2,4-dienoyl-CoA reductase [Pseudovibrio denitrificans]|uniref:2,4-dienoyl-CoA reductase n=1 Tax=Pseudovibrio denitrificans TaxID=258256 RepID=A0A1I7CK74_9HYPH|nr:NADH:flavin oxidoreductase/NADH oxidase family protein [Pseudovibrio denitrificans]SFT99831.1 2,4-dienoyl-CoA reductase [Pseudovibrio denitrificans]
MKRAETNIPEAITTVTAPAKIGSAFMLRNGVTLKNRFFKAAMAEQLADKHHNPKPGLVTLYKTWAEGGAGLLVTGNLMIDRHHLGEPMNVVLDEESDLSLFREWARAGSSNNTQIWAQLNHPGKQVPNFIQKHPVAPSAIPFEGDLQKHFEKPRALKEAEIYKIIGQFARSARLAKEQGFTGVQIHGAHGYLINQFLSTRHNQRGDKWGGSLENRMRFLLEVYYAIRKEVGDEFPIGIKLNSADFAKGGFTEKESMQVIVKLDEVGMDLIEISGGTYESMAMADGGTQKESTRRREAYFLKYAEQARKMSNVPLVVTGGFRSTKGMNDALASGATDLIGVARPMTVQPDMPKRAMANENYSIKLRALTTGFPALDQATVLNLSWYVTQIVRISKGKKTNPNTSEWISIVRSFLNQGIYAFRKLRA